jgi:hypothetical protein
MKKNKKPLKKDEPVEQENQSTAPEQHPTKPPGTK